MKMGEKESGEMREMKMGEQNETGEVDEVKLNDFQENVDDMSSVNQVIESAPKSYIEDRPKYILLEKTKALYTLMHGYLELFPKSEKFTLRQKIEDVNLECIKLLVIQNYKQTDGERKATILEFLANVHLFEVLVQQAVVFKYISFGGYQKVMPLVREINSFALSRYKKLNARRQSNENLH